MSDESQRPIVIKRIKKVAGGHHGGAWKIAYADFVTAMMAFFLLMWLLGSTTKADREGISSHFKNPLKVSLMGGSGAGDATSIIKGGGTDLTRSTGQEKRGPKASGQQVTEVSESEAKTAQKEKQALKELQEKMVAAIEANPVLNQFKNQILIDITAEGLRIQILDEHSRPMFASGSAHLQPYTKVLVHEIGKFLNDVPNRISVSGHTDSVPYPGGEKGYSNWELSADRANSVRRELLSGGMEESRIVRVIGLSSSVMLDPYDPANPINRRVSLIVMNKKAEEIAAKDGGVIDAKDIQGAPDISNAVESQAEEVKQEIAHVTPSEPAKP
ncbi:MAG: flagellar motor protein MotB [Burkholderiales bacterium]